MGLSPAGTWFYPVVGRSKVGLTSGHGPYSSAEFQLDTKGYYMMLNLSLHSDWAGNSTSLAILNFWCVSFSLSLIAAALW